MKLQPSGLRAAVYLLQHIPKFFFGRDKLFSCLLSLFNLLQVIWLLITQTLAFHFFLLCLVCSTGAALTIFT